MENIIKDHSHFYWKHLFRRIGTNINCRYHMGEALQTNALIRQIIELAVDKYATNGRRSDICTTRECKTDEILGGKFAAAAELYPSEGFTFAGHAKQVEESDQWVLRDFTTKDFLDAFRIEGIAHNLWRLGAMRRAISKVGTVTFKPDGSVKYNQSKDEKFLIKSIDSRFGTNSLPLGVILPDADPEADVSIAVSYTHLTLPTTPYV